MPTPWKHPKSNSYYLNVRVPTDLVEIVGRRKILRSLGTKNLSEAHQLICEPYMALRREWELLRRQRESLVELSPDMVRPLADTIKAAYLAIDDLQSLKPTPTAITLESVTKGATLEALAEMFKQGVQAPSLSAQVERMTNALLEAKGIKSDSDNLILGQLKLAVARAQAQAHKAVMDRAEGEPIDTPPVPVLHLVRLSTVIQHYLDEKAKGSMGKKLHAALPKLLEIVGDRSVSEIKQTHLLEFFKIIQRIPTQRGGKKRPDGMSLRGMAGDEITMAPATFENNYVSPIRLFLSWAKSNYQDQGFPVTLTTDGLDYQGSRKEGDEKQRAMKRRELERMFEGDELKSFADDPTQHHKFWLPMLGLFTGARVNELCQINPQTDIKEAAEIWCLNISEDSDADERVTKSVKTHQDRLVPIHPELIRLGFLEYVERLKKAGHKLLFPEFRPKVGKASGTAREWFSAFINEIELRDETPGAQLVGFHTFRHTLVTHAANHDDPTMEVAIDQITGHAGPGSSSKRGYISERDVRRKFDTICKVDFGLSFPVPRCCLD